jgi:hypothetical protein
MSEAAAASKARASLDGNPHTFLYKALSSFGLKLTFFLLRVNEEGTVIQVPEFARGLNRYWPVVLYLEAPDMVALESKIQALAKAIIAQGDGLDLKELVVYHHTAKPTAATGVAINLAMLALQ